MHDIPKSEFDIMLLQEEQAITVDLIRAEQECEEAMKQARRLGIVLR